MHTDVIRERVLILNYLDLAKQHFLGSNVTYVWLGGRKGNNGTWIWIDGQNFSYKNWATGIKNRILFFLVTFLILFVTF